MHAGRLDVSTALAAAKQQRSIINPIGMFPDLLCTLDAALAEERAAEAGQAGSGAEAEGLRA